MPWKYNFWIGERNNMEINQNPFHYNYVFKDEDINRPRIHNWRLRYPFLLLAPTYVQIADKYSFHFKIWKNEYYLLDVKVA